MRVVGRWSQGPSATLRSPDSRRKQRLSGTAACPSMEHSGYRLTAADSFD
jgi:hypothetical protein